MKIQFVLRNLGAFVQLKKHETIHHIGFSLQKVQGTVRASGKLQKRPWLTCAQNLSQKSYSDIKC